MKKLFLLCVLSIISRVCLADDFETKAKYAFLVDADTNTVLLEKNADKLMAPASMSKLMTAYLLFEKLQSGQIKPDDTFLVSQNAWKKGGEKSGSSTMFLKPNSQVKVSDLLQGIIVQSGNDACITVAENLSGSEENFAMEMQLRAREIGMEKSTFANSTGWPDPNQQMTAKELAFLAKKIYDQFPEFYKVYSQKSFKYNGIKQENRNPLLYSMPNQADGLKTGHTAQSGFGLVGSAKSKDGKRRLFLVINGLKTMKDRDIESKRLMDWGLINFDNYEIKANEKKPLYEIPVWLGKQKTVEAVLEKDVEMTLNRLDKPKVKIQVSYDKAVQAPVKKGQVIASLVITLPDGKKSYYPLVAKQDVKKMGFFKKIGFVLHSLFYGEN